MPSDVIPCPACRHPVRVPESLLGQPVRCPSCKSYFNAPVRDLEGNLGEPELLAEAPPPPSPQRLSASTNGSSPVFVPAMFLLLVGVIGTLVNGYKAVVLFTNTEVAKQNAFEDMKKFAELLKVPFKEDQAKLVTNSLPFILGAAFVVSLTPLFGALAMLLGRGWSFGVLGGVGAMFNFGTCCCLIGFPVGVYCLIKLFDPDIRAYFKRPIGGE